MFLVTVTPLKKAISKETLSYISRERAIVGSAIHVPIRNKESLALVNSCELVRNKKSDIKNAGYALRPLKKQRARHIVLPEFIVTAEIISRLTASTTGAVLTNVLPLTLIEESSYTVRAKKRTSSVQAPEPRALHAPLFDRPQLYRRLAREVLATNKSFLIVAPTIQRARDLYAILRRGIEDQSFILESSRSQKKQVETWSTAIESEKAVLIVSTPGYIAIPRHDLGAIIIDGESDSSYRSLSRPFIDTRLILLEYSKLLGIDCHLADNFFRTETFANIESGNYQYSYPFSLRTIGNGGEKIISMNEETNAILRQTNKPRTVNIPLISHEVSSVIDANHSAGRKTFLFVNRTGIAPQTICADCGTPITCPACKLPAMLHESKSGSRMYACWHCQEVLSTNTLCPTCNGWRLVPLGIGADAVVADVRALLPEVPLFQIDGIHTKTHIQAHAVFQEVLETPGAVLVGTEMALRAIDTPIDSCIVVSIDNRFSIPDFRIYEYTYRTLNQLRERSIEPLIIQTRHPKHPVFNYFQNKSFSAFYEQELSERKTYGYPPFSALIRLSVTAPKSVIETLVHDISRVLINVQSVNYEALRSFKKGESTTHILITVPLDAWFRVARNQQEEGDENYTELLHTLRLLPQHVRIEYDPLTIM
ncbi:MAG: hypothetical protein Q8Q18_02585 [bacterium]|nr:hypothetical protein [bacterium]